MKLFKVIEVSGVGNSFIELKFDGYFVEIDDDSTDLTANSLSTLKVKKG